MANYNPDSFSHGCPPATIAAEEYIVTDYSISEPPVEIEFQTGTGAHRGTALEDGKLTATMTIEVEDTTQTAPALYATFDYQGKELVIKQIDFSRSAGSASTWSLQLNIVGDSSV